MYSTNQIRKMDMMVMMSRREAGVFVKDFRCFLMTKIWELYCFVCNESTNQDRASLVLVLLFFAVLLLEAM